MLPFKKVQVILHRIMKGLNIWKSLKNVLFASFYQNPISIFYATRQKYFVLAFEREVHCTTFSNYRFGIYKYYRYISYSLLIYYLLFKYLLDNRHIINISYYFAYTVVNGHIVWNALFVFILFLILTIILYISFIMY